MSVLLDTDHLSVLQWQEQPACDRLLARLDQLPPDDIATSIVSFHEQAQGWLVYVKRARTADQIVEAYAKLERTLAFVPENERVVIHGRSARTLYEVAPTVPAFADDGPAHSQHRADDEFHAIDSQSS